MAVVQSFPLFNLPLLPLNEVISYMCPVDQLWFSTISKKTNNLVKQKQKFDLKVTEDRIVCKNQNGLEILSVDINPLSDQNSNCLTRKIGDLNVPMNIEENYIETFWKKEIDGLREVTSFLCEVFKIESISICLFPKNLEKNYQIIDHTQKLKSKFKTSIRKIKLATLDRSASWFTLKHFDLLSKCSEVKLSELKLTAQEVNLFLKKWMESTTLEDVELNMKEVNLEMVIEGLPARQQNKKLKLSERVSAHKVCFEIQRNGGAKIYIWNNGATFVRTHNAYFFSES